MRRILPYALLLMFMLPATPARLIAGELLDGIAVAVNHKPILLSDWDEAVCYEAFMQRKPLAQVTEADRAKALQRLVDRHLLKAQMTSVHSLEPADKDLQNDLAKLRSQVPEGKDEQSWQRLLASYGLNDELVKAHLRTEMQIMNFVEVRLRPSVHVQPEEIESYYRHQLLPDLEATGSKVISLADVEPKIRELLIQQRVDELLDAWLHNLRQQADVQRSMMAPESGAPSQQESASGAH